MINPQLNVICETLSLAEGPAELGELLCGLLTPREIDEISERIAIVKGLLSNKAQHQIAKELGVGVATVTRGSKELKLGRFKVLQRAPLRAIVKEGFSWRKPFK